MGRTAQPEGRYADQLLKMIPVEISGAFLAINTIIGENSKTGDNWAKGITVALILICILYLWKLEEVKSWPQILFSSLLAFPAWAFYISMDRYAFIEPMRWLPACILILVTLVAPLIPKLFKPHD